MYRAINDLRSVTTFLSLTILQKAEVMIQYINTVLSLWRVNKKSGI